MIRQLPVSTRALLGYGTIFGALLTAVLTALLLIDGIEATALLDGEETRRQVHVLRIVEWATLALGTVLCLFWGIHTRRSVAKVDERCRSVADRVRETAGCCSAGSDAVVEAGKAADAVKTEIDRIVRHALELGQGKVKAVFIERDQNFPDENGWREEARRIRRIAEDVGVSA